MKKLYFFGVIFLLLANCEKKEPLEDHLEQASVETVGINEAIDFLGSKNILSRGTSPDYVVFDLEGIVHEEITNSNELLTVVPATTVYGAHYSRILLLKIDGAVQSVVFSLYPSEEATDDIFSGEIMVTDMDGNFLNGYRVSNGVLVAQFTTKPVENSNGTAHRAAKPTCSVHGECTPNTDCVMCIQELAEIIIVSNDRNNSGGGGKNYFPITYIYYGGGGNGPLSGIQNTGLEWGYGGGGSGDNSGGNGGNDKEVWDCGGSKVYNPRTKACECPDGMVDNGYECVVDYEIINRLTGKARCVYEKLMRSTINNHNIITETFLYFGKGNPFNSNLIYKLEPEIFFENIVADGSLPPLGYFEKKGNDYIISLNKDKLDNRAPLEVARTILHESVHALLRYHYVNANNSFVDLFGIYI